MSFPQALVKSVNFNPYSSSLQQQVKSLRKSNQLAVDHYLDSLASLYPPKGVPQLLDLVGQIEASSTLTSQEQALLIYYIFCAFDADEKSKGMADYYAQELVLPVSWQNYARGLWALQSRDNDRALALLGTFPAPKQVIECYIRCLESTPELLCLFFDSHRQYLDHDNLKVYIESLCTQALFFHVLEIARGYTLRQEEILEVMGRHAAQLKSGPALRAFISVPFSHDEWSVIQKYLDEMPKDSPAGQLSLVRALSLGDLPEINKMKDVKCFEILTESYDDY